MKNYTLIIGFLCFTGFNTLFSQDNLLKDKLFQNPERKSEIWGYWGYNRGQFTLSNIHFEGPGYDFTLYDVEAKDRQSELKSGVYWNPRWLTVPQFNIRFGYFITDRFSLSFGYDHMKYVMVPFQIVKIDGNISNEASPIYEGEYNSDEILLSPDFLRFEHTNGLNYISFDGDFYGKLWRSSNEKHRLDFMAGFGAGILYPRSDIDLFNIEGVNVFHTAGWGTNLTLGIRFDFYKYFFLNFHLRSGFISMPNILTMVKGHKAKQNFFFLQEVGTFGFTFPLHKKEK